MKMPHEHDTCALSVSYCPQHSSCFRTSCFVIQSVGTPLADPAHDTLPRLPPAGLHAAKSFGIERREQPDNVKLRIFHAFRPAATGESEDAACFRWRRSRYLLATIATKMLAAALLVASTSDPPTCSILSPGKYHRTKPCRSFSARCSAAIPSRMVTATPMIMKPITTPSVLKLT